jgi:hypothetical protein
VTGTSQITLPTGYQTQIPSSYFFGPSYFDLFLKVNDPIVNVMHNDSGDLWTGDEMTINTDEVIAGIDKQIIDGPDVDIDGEIDKVVEAGQSKATNYTFKITYTNHGGPDVLVIDTVPS